MRKEFPKGVSSFRQFRHFVAFGDRPFHCLGQRVSLNITKLRNLRNDEINQTTPNEVVPSKLKNFVKNNIDLFWIQTQRFFRYNGKAWPTYREISIGNKSKEKNWSEWRLFIDKKPFESFILKEIGRYDPPAIFLSQQRYIMPYILDDLLKEAGLSLTHEDLKERYPENFNNDMFAIFTDFVLDLDFKDNPDVEKSFTAISLLDSELRKLGIEILWKVSGNGIHGLLDVTNLIYTMSLGEWFEFSHRIHEKYKALVDYFEQFLSFKGFEVKFDRDPYKTRGTIRALYSPHVKGLVSVPLNLWKPLSWNIERARSIGSKKRNPWITYWGKLDRLSAPAFLRLLKNAEFLSRKEERPKARARIRFRPKGEMAPCMAALIERAKEGENLSHFSRFALVSYLLKAGWEEEQIIDIFRNQPDFKESKTRYQVEHISKHSYLPPSCSSLKERGLCVADCGLKNPLAYLRIQRREGVR